ncbi:UDP-galactose-4-epimerase [Spirochaetia bacterium]|nr:UDP-galactose-4-epimerase [Spirochaetia bacterium]
MKSVLFTGASGFLGMNILPMLSEIYDVSTLGIGSQMTYNINLAEQMPEFNKRHDIVLHAAGKAHSVPKSPKDAQVFFDVNYQGTKNLCNGLEKSGSPYSFVFISTIAVYGRDYGELIDESHPLNAETPYGKSKIQAEEFLLEWCDRKNVLLTILRPSLLAGRNPPGNLGSMIKGISKGMYFSIAGGETRKSIAMVDDIGRLLPYCEEKSGIFNLCDSHNPTFKELEELISRQLGKPLPINISMRFAKYMAKIGDLCNFLPINTRKLEKITKSLTFSNDKIQKELNFIPSDVLSNFLIC